ncbi:MAG: KH domain-containing protein [Candidatus ainarchaeum sp.]|nr:KH domain-containing protein [Candidatus ainarchaeum sp.]MDD3975693.1 KH domain-containing protein [Candidatus ainarchaeum sp.]
MEDEIKVTKKRLAVIIGENGQTKKDIQKKTSTNLNINSHTGEIIISTKKSFYEIHIAKNILTAISRGFSPEVSFNLLEDNFLLEIIDLDDFVKNTRNRHEQIRGRVIGKDGHIKKMIEDKLHCFISVYGKTVSIIGYQDNISEVRDVIEKILQGVKHTTVFKMLKSLSLKAEGYKKVKTQEVKIDDISFD